ncbi:MAG: DUF975 family protein, partial [Treponema sp.]|nr:DUF975 family protein [Treponema sp.]
GEKMFDRQKYKYIARLQLKGRRGVPVLATLTVIAVVFLIYLPDRINRYRQLLYGLGYPKQTSVGNALSFLVPFLVYFIYGVMTMAYTYLHVVMSHTTKEVKFSTYINGFNFWLQGVLGYLWRLLWVTLWSMLFVIPGIVKSYSYSQMFFILAENPDIPVRKAMRMSILMTNGHKADLFKLDMSFIGWTILSLLTGGLVELWVGPYRAMAKVNAFHALKEEALRVGVLERYDFGEDEANSVEENNSAENNPPAEKAVQVQEEKAVTQEPAAFIKEDTQIEYDVLDESDNPENIGEDK